MTGNARERLGEALRRLHEDAAGPPLKTLRVLTYGGRTYRASETSVSDWLNGKSVPQDPAKILALIGHLTGLAAGTGGARPVDPALRALLARAVAERDGRRGGRPAAAPPRRSGLVPMTVPAVDGFTGREKRVNDLLALLHPDTGSQRPVAVTGMGGVGKTALVLHTAGAAVRNGWFPGGAVLAEARGYSDGPETAPEAVLHRFLTAFGRTPRDIPPLYEERLDVWHTLLRERAERGDQVLVVLDNVRSARLVGLLPGAPHRSLVTTRQGWSGGRTRRFPLDVLTQDDAVLMLTRIVNADGPDGRVAADPAAARELVELCGRLPLAVLVVGALLRSSPERSVAGQAAALRDTRERLARLGREEEQEDGRPLAVRSSLDLSYRHLAPERQRAFRLLSAAPGPSVSAEAAAVLLGVEEEERGDDYRTGEMLADLRDAQLLRPGEDGRWSAHDLVRLFSEELGRERAGPDGRDDALRRLLAWYARVADSADRRLQGAQGGAGDRFADRPAALAWLEPERENLLAAVRRAAGQGLHREAVTLAMGVADFLRHGRRLDEALETARLGLESARALGDAFTHAQARQGIGLVLVERGDADGAIAAHREAAGILRDPAAGRPDPDPALGTVLSALGEALSHRKRWAEAAQAQEEALRIFRATGDRSGEGIALTAAGTDLMNQGLTARAREPLTVAVDIMRGTEHLRGLSHSLTALGLLRLRTGEPAAAAEAHREAVELDRRLGDRGALGVSLCNLGGALVAAFRYEEAEAVCAEAADVLRATGDLDREAAALANRGLARSSLGRYEQAAEDLGAALGFARTVDDPVRLGTALNNQALLFQRMGRFDEALEWYAEAVEALTAGDDVPLLASTLLGQALTLDRLERWAEALPVMVRVVAVFRETGDWRLGSTLSTLSEVLWREGRFEDARAAHAEGMVHLRERADSRALAVALRRQAAVLQSTGDLAGAAAAVAEIAGCWRDVAEVMPEVESRVWLGELLRADGREAEAREQWALALETMPEGANDALADALREVLAVPAPDPAAGGTEPTAAPAGPGRPAHS